MSKLRLWKKRKKKKKLTPEQLEILTKEVNKVILEDWWKAGDALESLIHANKLAQDLYFPFDGKIKLTKEQMKKIQGKCDRISIGFKEDLSTESEDKD